MLKIENFRLLNRYWESKASPLDASPHDTSLQRSPPNMERIVPPGCLVKGRRRYRIVNISLTGDGEGGILLKLRVQCTTVVNRTLMVLKFLRFPSSLIIREIILFYVYTSRTLIQKTVFSLRRRSEIDNERYYYCCYYYYCDVIILGDNF